MKLYGNVLNAKTFMKPMMHEFAPRLGPDRQAPFYNHGLMRCFLDNHINEP
jgi:hypothetical protein